MSARNIEEYQRVQNEHPEIVAGASTAAVLLFLHIALTGYLGFAIVHLLRSAGSELDWAGTLTWQYFFPAFLAVLTYFPSDPLTRTVGRVALGTGALALATAIGVSTRFSGAEGLFRCLSGSCAGGGAAVLLAEAFRLGLPKAPLGGRTILPPFSYMPSAATALALAVAACIWVYTLYGKALQVTAVFWSLVGVGAALLIFRLAEATIRRGR